MGNRGLLQATRSSIDSSTGQVCKHRPHHQTGPVQLSRTPLLGLASLCNSQCTGVSVSLCCPRDADTLPTMIMTFMKYGAYDGGLPMRSTHSHPIYKLLATLKQKGRRPAVAVCSVCCYNYLEGETSWWCHGKCRIVDSAAWLQYNYVYMNPSRFLLRCSVCVLHI